MEQLNTSCHEHTTSAPEVLFFPLTSEPLIHNTYREDLTSF